MIKEILNIALSVINADVASFGLETAPGLMNFETRAQLAPGGQDQLTVWQGITGRVMRSGQFAISGEVTADPDYVAAIPGMRSEIVVPIMLNGRPIGVLDLESAKGNAFNTSHLSFLTTLAEHAAIAINKAQLFADTQRRNEEMRAILDSTHDGMVLLSPRGELLQANPAAERILTINLRAMMGKNLIMELARNARRGESEQRVRYPWLKLRDTLRTLRSTPDIATRFTYYISANDSLRQIEETGVPVNDEQGHLTARLFVLRDITEIMELERFKEHLTDTVVHDLRSPLGSVITSLYLIDEATRDEDFTTIRKVTPAALTLANDLLSMVTSILEVRKMQNGALDLEKVPTPLQRPVERAIQTVAFVAQQFNISIQNLLPPDLPDLDIDVEKIRRVMVNLLDNALKFTPDQGQVRIEANFQPARHLVLISVTDTGQGIPEEYRDRVFEMFTTVPKELSIGRRRGTGIGLTFCRLTVEAHGGRIWADNGPEGGTAIRFTLPVAAPANGLKVSQEDGLRTVAEGSA
jgi:PAS domain S-box-containing protein